MPGFLPSRDAELLAWSANFETLITAEPTTYGLTAAQATAYANVHTAYASALTAATEPNTRTKVTVAAKDAARFTLKAQARLLAKLVEGTSTVTDAQKLALGLNVRATPTPIPPPTAAPDIDIVSVSGNTVKLKLHNAAALHRAKPAGVQGAAVFSFVGANPPTTEAGWKFEGNTTRTVVDVQFPDTVAPGAKVWFTAFWFNPRAQSGPAASPVGTHIAGGSAMAA